MVRAVSLEAAIADQAGHEEILSQQQWHESSNQISNPPVFSVASEFVSMMPSNSNWRECVCVFSMLHHDDQMSVLRFPERVRVEL